MPRLFLDDAFRNVEEGVIARNLIESWEEYHGKAQHGECRICELATWLNGFFAFNVHPQPYQGDAEVGLYRGQPVVWDGSWECRDGQLWYVGGNGASGGTGKAQRAIVLEDRIMFI